MPLDLTKLHDGDLLTITPRVRLGMWLTESVLEDGPLKGAQRFWAICPIDLVAYAEDRKGVKVTLTQHGQQSYTVSAYAMTEELAIEEAIAIAQRHCTLYGNGAAKDPTAGED